MAAATALSNAGPWDAVQRVLIGREGGIAGRYQAVQNAAPRASLQHRDRWGSADSTGGTIPTGYLILNVTTGHSKRHTCGYVWEIPEA